MATEGDGGRHWADMKERGAAWGPALMGLIYRVLGRTGCRIVATPVILYFYLAGRRQRLASLDYLRRVWRFQGRPGRPGHRQAIRHFLAFGDSLIDKMEAWIGRIDRLQVDEIESDDFEAMRNDRRGTLILSAHVGATEIVRAIASRHQKRRINILIHSPHAARYNALIQRYAPQSQVSLVQVSAFNVGTAAALSATIERGEWVVIMADRMPLKDTGRAITADFLGAPAAFPEGPFVLAAALRCPVYTLFCYKQNGRYRSQVSLLTDGVALPRGQRAEGLQQLVRKYVAELQTLVLSAPYQWFNFYAYWTTDGDASGNKH
ncbi:hypothetical protein [Brevundimonas sp. FT23042]|uniref:LpxL/LpxP family acyltransferase n=1 Tax=Brevundimonas sp. FT23042 TaxID=3393749 RepID=UPI003B586856